MIKSSSRIFIAGHNGMVGSAIVRLLKQKKYTNLILKNRLELDLTCQSAVKNFFENEKPDFVVLAAAKVGGIFANNEYPADFIYENLMIQGNIIHQSYKHKVKRILFLGSSCIYPKFANQPIRENYLLNGKLESTNEPYAIAKIAGIKLCESYNRQYGCDFRSVMPTNLYGPKDNFHPENSHVVPALIGRFHEAKVNQSEQVLVWGNGLAKREFLYVDDLADACLHILQLSKKEYVKYTHPMNSQINIGTGKDVTIRELAETIKGIVGFQGKILWDKNKPDGTPRKLLDVSLAAKMGWTYKVSLREGLEKSYQWYLTQQNNNL